MTHVNLLKGAAAWSAARWIGFYIICISACSGSLCRLRDGHGNRYTRIQTWLLCPTLAHRGKIWQMCRSIIQKRSESFSHVHYLSSRSFKATLMAGSVFFNFVHLFCSFPKRVCVHWLVNLLAHLRWCKQDSVCKRSAPLMWPEERNTMFLTKKWFSNFFQTWTTCDFSLSQKDPETDWRSTIGPSVTRENCVFPNWLVCD